MNLTFPIPAKYEKASGLNDGKTEMNKTKAVVNPATRPGAGDKLSAKEAKASTSTADGTLPTITTRIK